MNTQLATGEIAAVSYASYLRFPATEEHPNNGGSDFYNLYGRFVPSPWDDSNFYIWVNPNVARKSAFET